MSAGLLAILGERLSVERERPGSTRRIGRGERGTGGREVGSLRTCTAMCVCALVGVRVCVCMCICVCVFMCVHACAHVCVYEYIQKMTFDHHINVIQI